MSIVRRGSASLHRKGAEDAKGAEIGKEQALVAMDRLNKLSEQVIGAAIEVHRHLGAGFLESTYEQALSVELNLRGIKHTPQTPVSLQYKGESIGEGKIDILVEGQLIVELKAVKELVEAHQTQVLAYLKATEYQLGLLINFHSPLPKDGIKRVILEDKSN